MSKKVPEQQKTVTQTPPGSDRTKMLALVVFLSGASLMGLEIAGSRVIAPTFGSSIYTWGSLIGIFMLALSVGYYAGGKLADKFPSYFTLATVLGIAGVLTIVIPFVAFPVCEAFAPLKQKWGSMAACLVLFGLPSIMMGMVSPVAIRLAAREIASLGGVAGSLYAISTVGSIAGTFLTSFWLLELAGMSTLVKGVGAALILNAIIALALGITGGKARVVAVSKAALLLVVAAGAFAIPAPLSVSDDAGKVLVTSDSPYNTLFVIDYENGERNLQFNDRRESGFLLSSPQFSSFEYTGAVHCAFALKRDVKNVLLIGGGGAVLPIEMICAYDNMDMWIDSVEIDPGVIEYSRKYFIDHAVSTFRKSSDERERVWADLITERINLIEADGRIFVQESEKKYDLIIMDAYLGGRIPFHLTTIEYFRDVRKCLVDDGVLAMNIISGWRGKTSNVFTSLHRTVNELFPNIMLVPMQSYMFEAHNFEALVEYQAHPSNIILIASMTEDQKMSGEKFKGIVRSLGNRGFYPPVLSSKVVWRSSYAGTVEEFEQDERDFMDRLKQSGMDVPAFKPIIDPTKVPILTDEYAPVDIWSGHIMLHR